MVVLPIPALTAFDISCMQSCMRDTLIKRFLSKSQLVVVVFVGLAITDSGCSAFNSRLAI